MSVRSILVPLFVTVGLWLTGCSVDVDGYTFVEEVKSSPNELEKRLTMARERSVGEWATPCIEGSDDEDDPRAGSKYVYTFGEKSMRLDMFAYTADCDTPLWVQSIEADYSFSGIDREVEDAFELTLEISDRRIMLLQDQVADDANGVDANEDGTPDGLFGRTDWVAGEWFNLLGVAAADGQDLSEGEEAFILVVFLERDRAIGASLVTVGAVPRGVLMIPFERSDGSEGAGDL